MKKMISIVLVFALAAVCVGCGSATAQTSPAPVEGGTAETPVPVQEPEITAQQEPESVPSAEDSVPEAEPETEQETGSTELVVVFSGTGTTLGVAEKIAELTGAELVEIVPAQPYTAEDLNYNDSSTRATVE